MFVTGLMLKKLTINTKELNFVRSVVFMREWKLIFIWKVSTRTRFEKEAKDNSEMAYRL